MLRAAGMKAHVERTTAGHTQLGLESLVDDTMSRAGNEVGYLYGLRAFVNELLQSVSMGTWNEAMFDTYQTAHSLWLR